MHAPANPQQCQPRAGRLYDPFLGSGTTLIAAETTGRFCLGLELSPAYVDVIVERWQGFTGKNAVLDGDGRTFSEISKDREIEGEDRTATIEAPI